MPTARSSSTFRFVSSIIRASRSRTSWRFPRARRASPDCSVARSYCPCARERLASSTARWASSDTKPDRARAATLVSASPTSFIARRWSIAILWASRAARSRTSFASATFALRRSTWPCSTRRSGPAAMIPAVRRSAVAFSTSFRAAIASWYAARVFFAPSPALRADVGPSRFLRDREEDVQRLLGPAVPLLKGGRQGLRAGREGLGGIVVLPAEGLPGPRDEPDGGGEVRLRELQEVEDGLGSRDRLGDLLRPLPEELALVRHRRASRSGVEGVPGLDRAHLREGSGGQRCPRARFRGSASDPRAAEIAMVPGG